MKLDKFAYLSCYLVVLSCSWFLGVGTETTVRYSNSTLDEGSGEVEELDSFSGLLMTNDTEEPDQSSQDNHIGDDFVWTKNENAPYFDNQALLGHIIVEYDNAYTVTQCSHRCMYHVPECLSYNYKDHTHVCQLNSLSHLEVPDDIQNMTGAAYYHPDTFQTSENILGGCALEECLNGGRCIDLLSHGTEETVVCSCSFEYGFGTRCNGSPEVTGWSEWSDWSSCSVTCEDGWRSRTRECQGSQDGEIYCLGDSIQTEKCTFEPCPYWEEWSQWSDCSSDKTCGDGYQTKMRGCLHNGTPGVDRMCMGPLTANKTCVRPSCSGAVRLIKTDVYGVGSIEVYNDLQMEWGQLCGDGWEKEDADIICHQLGFHDGAFAAINDGSLALPSGPIVLTEMNCIGTELNLQNCQHDDWLAPDECNSNPAAVKCIVDGGWDEWSFWSACSVTCADGLQTRTRTCVSPPPSFGGDYCPDEDTQYKNCTMIPCPVDGTWHPWIEWSHCNETCGGGWSYRNRECNEPLHSGEPCPGPSEQWKECNTHPCPVNGYWKPWQEWQECNVTCGGGTQVRERVCVEPLHGGSTCEGLNDQWRDCGTNPCPVDCTWNAWSLWQSCNVTCGDGWQIRMRNMSLELHGGKPCLGDLHEWRPCFPRHCPIHCVWNPWTEWQACSITCGLGWQERNRTKEDEKYGGDPCIGDLTEGRECYPGPCPVDGDWNPWSLWTDCSHTCGNGTRERERTCHYGLHGGQNCTGHSQEIESCYLKSCAIDGVWEPWSEWGECSVTCNDGTQVRNRTCTGPFYGGKPCPGPADEIQDCFPIFCPVDGVWKEWGQWQECDVTCGGGTQWRQRVCDEPQHGGMQCLGDNQEFKMCGEQSCPVNGSWTEWSEWAICNVTCGGGTTERNRTCIGQAHGGSSCEGNSRDITSCSTNPCPVDGMWSRWSSWKECSVTCGGGIQWRNRTCEGTMYGGNDCPGEANESQGCSSNPCPVDGNWTVWSSWNECNVTCGGGSRRRSRTCEDRAHGGLDCVGDQDEVELCSIHPCPVDGEWSDWAAWSNCTVSCGGGTAYRIRQCEGRAHGGEDCDGVGAEQTDCNTHHCPVDGFWSTWQAWESCSESCGGGISWRTRTCDGRAYGGEDCLGHNEEQTDCNTLPCPIDGWWEAWGNWSSCTVTCGGGTQWRTRLCVGTAHGGQECEGISGDKQDCNVHECPVERPWLEWQEWSKCSVTCGGGTRTRIRECLQEDLEGNYKPFCEGINSTMEACHEYNCMPIARSCDEWKSRGMRDDCYAEIDPKESEQYTVVYCDTNAMEDVGLTLLLHDKMNRTKVDGYEGAGSYKMILEYVLDISEMKTIISMSKGCRQYVRWECHSAAMRNPYNDKIANPVFITYWTNRHEEKQYYWGGGDPNGEGCACDVDKTCDDSDYICNCDVNDDVLREDSGYLTSKDDLPMLGFYAGDTGSPEEYGFVTLGAVECWGLDENYNPEEEDDGIDYYNFG